MRLAGWVFALAAVGTAAAGAVEDSDPYLWLSDIHGEKALAWVKQQNAKSEAVLKADSRYGAYHEAILKSLDAKDRIPLGNLDHGSLYNFWQDAGHVRGLWRRAAMSEYRKPEPAWEILLDVDKLDADERKDWVFQGAECTRSQTRCLVRLSPGGGDAAEYREFDPRTHALQDNGFKLAAAKSNAAYVDDDTIVFATDFGPGTMTASSYPRIMKLWHRGRPLAAAKTVFEGKAEDIAVRSVVLHGAGGLTNARATVLIERGVTFFSQEYYFLRADGGTVKLPLPEDVNLQGASRGNLIVILRSDWKFGKTTYVKGSLLAVPMRNFLKTGKMPTVVLLAEPDSHSTIDSVAVGRDAVYASIYRDVTGSIHVFRPAKGKWTETKLLLPKFGSTVAVTADDWAPGALFTYESFLSPPTLFEDRGDGAVLPIKSQSALFDTRNMVSEQHWTTSKDGVQVPYFLIHKHGLGGNVPTILYSYGGFELALTPWYWNDGHRPLDAGQIWLAKGGAIAVANIRGGGEFGPAWHQAALKENRQKAFDDFAAVAKDLETRGFTTPEHLGIVGASNGGVLTTVTMTQHPELIHAVVCQRPLVDMLRYTHFGAGASWVEEYGDPDKPEDRAYIEKYSAYQNVRPDGKYPSILFITETSDDRVTPIWARMMAAKMQAQGHDVLFNEAAEGGHGPGSTNAAQADMWALSYVYLARELGLGG